MAIEVRYFASLTERAGTLRESVEIEPSASVADLWGVLVVRHPRLAEVTVRPLAACDLVYASWDRSLHGVHEVAFLPPVSGG